MSSSSLLETFPTSQSRGAYVSVVADDHHPRIAKTRTPSISITYSPLLPAREMTAPEGPFRRRFFAMRPLCLLTLPRRRQRIDSVFYASMRQKERYSSKKSATRKDGAGVCAFPRADSQRIWSVCSRSWKNLLSSWARRYRE